MSPLVDGLPQEFGVLLCERCSIQIDKHHSLAAFHRRSVCDPGASVGLLVGGSKPRRRRGVPRPLTSRGGGPGGGPVLAATKTTSPRVPRPSVLLRRWWLLVAPLLVEAAELTFDKEP